MIQDTSLTVLLSESRYIIDLKRQALHSILTYLAASKTIGYLVQGVEEYKGVTIILQKSAWVIRILITKSGRGIAIYKGKRRTIRKQADLDDVLKKRPLHE